VPNFVVPQGVEHRENRSALAAVGRVADCVCGQRLRREVNPFFLHGPSGSGKTYLVSALVSSVIRRRPEVTCSLLPAGDCAALLWEGEAPAEPWGPARQEPRPPRLAPEWDSDLLVIEDLQHLPARAADELAHLHDGRIARQQQTVYTANAGPAQLFHLPARLTSRLASGLVVGLELLAPASRFAFLQDRAQRRQLAVGRDVLLWLADHCGGSARQLEGALTRVEMLVRLNDRLPDLATVTAHFQVDFDAARPTVERIAERVGRYFQVEPRQMQSRRRLRYALLPRQVGMYLARQLTPLSLEQIGAYFGGRDHSTVLHACRKVEQALARDAALSGAVQRLHADLA
jgi:chromosomal replication initiator protein